MNLQLILATNLVLVPDKEIVRPLFFLGGPIRGGGNWQLEACKLLAKQASELAIAVPNRWDKHSELWHLSADGEEKAFERQTLWERHYLARAAKWGCIIFWLGLESQNQPRQDGQLYGRDTAGELGEWRGRMMTDPSIRLVVGANPGYPGLDVIQCNFDAALGKKFTIYSSLQDTIEAAAWRSIE